LLPDARSRPRRITITSDDIVWYADFSRGYLGRLDPATGKVTEWLSPSGPKSEPYGISAINDIIWTASPVQRRIPWCASIRRPRNSRAGRSRGGGNIVRNTSVTRQGDFVLANSLVNAVTLVKISK
jgi:virginiamycin B lyase